MHLKKETTGIIALVIVATVFIFLRFNEFFHTPNSKVIEPWGDGYKSYAAVVYHVKYDSTYSHLEGMNYPYGEHVVPGDTQPLFSNAIRWISRNLIDISDYTIGIIHFSLLLSLLLCGLFLYLIFRKLHLPVWYGIIAAIGITFLSPQIERMTAHFGLAHAVVIPLILYLLLRFDERPGLAGSLWIALAVLLVSQIHFYYFAILTFTVGFYFFFRFLQEPGWKALTRSAFHFGIQIGLPLIFFYWWMYFNDPVADRTAQPWGFFVYQAVGRGIFTSLTEPHWRWVQVNLFDIKSADIEGKAYIGLAATIALVVIPARWAWRQFREPVIQIPGAGNRFWSALFWAALVILLFSMGYPFAIGMFEPLLDYAGPIRQFRSVGRFAWVFFYAINIIGFAWLYHWAFSDRKWWKRAIAVAALMVLCFEAWHFSRAHDLRLDEIEEFASGRRFTDIEGVNFREYQAVLPIPYYNIGSDNFWWRLSGFIGQKSMTISMQTGLPVTGAMLTRTSLSQTINQIQLVTEPYRVPKAFEDYPNDKPLLMAWDKQRVEEGNFGEYDHLLQGAQLVYEADPLQLYRLPLNSFAERIEWRKKKIRDEMAADSLVSAGPFRSTSPMVNFVYESFDGGAASNKYIGSGGYEGKMADQNTVFEGKLPAQEGGRYVFTTWMFINDDLYPRTELEYIEVNPATGEQVWRYTVEAREIVRAIDNNGWALLELVFEIRDDQSNIRFSLSNSDLDDASLFIDELLIRPFDTHLYRKADGYLWKDNRWFFVSSSMQ
jgi:hypothetical protein